ncbi:phosphate ABC transporter substrate-binding protein PstS [Acinetobacter sp. ANC 4636]|uniref:phosphate ABC transporter substrate-binding protein PstS n=1 Tax=Acinetobacter sp. ANC 4635 TaxID=2529846 RepID=UPI00103F9D08|nr:phosphate ABC transporter substrate-binding protein PstS [Acinetobacter sp. ANC 4635]TCB33448.1 phosphate ABC transporter substrate-binding protein PstS [Acinetobacter sp. ANC 4635]
MTYFSKKIFGALVASATLAISVAHAGEITGAGSTFVYPVLSKWSATYHAKTGNKINYQSIGSGGGIAQIKAGTVTFGASDMPLTPAELNAAGLKQFPIIIGGVVPVVNIDGVRPGALRLTGPVLADIFLGKVTKWNDPAIQHLNPSLHLPDQRISVVHRSDGSGTTFNWANYLSKVSPTWKSKVGEGTSISWPTGIGGKGNEGVAAYVKQIKGSIGYVELAYALQNRMSYTAMQNKAGHFVQPNTATFQAAAAGTSWNKSPDFYNVITNASGANSWPITATTFVIMHKQPKSAQASKEALDFFKWSLEHGQANARALDYIPLPANLTKQIEGYWIKNINVK